MFTLAAANPIDHVTDLILIGSPEMPILTMHMVMLVVCGLLTVWIMMTAAKGIVTGDASQGNNRYIARGRLAQLIEAIVVYLRNEMIVPVLGEAATRRYLPFLLSVFFFILVNNLLGLIPLVDLQHLLHLDAVTGGKTWFGGTATGNIGVTAALALCALIVIQIHAFRELGVLGWLQHHCGGLVPGPIFLAPVVVIVFIVEVAGDFIKPAALAIRLFANMVAGHTLMAVLLGFGAMAAQGGMDGAAIAGISLASGLFAVAISFLELFVAFLQAFIFMFLTTVFISLLSHHDEHHEEAHEHEAHDSHARGHAPATAAAH